MSFVNFFLKRKKLGLLSISLLAILLVSGALATSTLNNTANSQAPSLIPAGLSKPTHFGHTMMPTRTPIEATSGPLGCPLTATNCLASVNWGGYAVCDHSANCAAVISGTGSPKKGSVTAVQGSWIVPAIVGGGRSTGASCPDQQNTWYDVADWVGIDGFVSSTVEQTGTAVDCYYGQAYYYAWVEFYPAPSISVFNVTAGDVITAQVNMVGTTPASSTPGNLYCPASNAPCPVFRTTITDQTSHKTFISARTAVPGAQTDSAEWISESAAYGIGGLLGLLALTQTNNVRFFSSSATIHGNTRSIQSWGSNVYWLLMVNLNFGQNEECSPAACSTPSTQTLANAKSQPSALSGGSFEVRWLSSGP